MDRSEEERRRGSEVSRAEIHIVCELIVKKRPVEKERRGETKGDWEYSPEGERRAEGRGEQKRM